MYLLFDYPNSDGYIWHKLRAPHASYLMTLSLQNASPDVCKVLVGNKVDADDERIIDSSRGKSVSQICLINTSEFLH